MASLDIREPQIPIFYEQDQVQWHHRVLLRRLRDAVWVLATPELEMQVEDLSKLRLAAFPPAANIPAQINRENVHLFVTLSDARLQDLHAQATRMAAVLGGAAIQPEDSVPGRAHWLVSDPALENFGMPITDDIVNNGATGVTRNSIGMALVGSVWLPVERVADKDQTRWESSKRNGPGRDPRLAGGRRDAQNRHWPSLSDAVNTLRPTDLKKQKDWPHPGPQASEEAGIRAAGREIIPYHDLQGVASRQSIATARSPASTRSCSRSWPSCSASTSWTSRTRRAASSSAAICCSCSGRCARTPVCRISPACTR